MTPQRLLDTDMQTIGRWLVRGWRWWIDELRALAPAGRAGGRAAGAPRFLFRDGALVPVSGKHRRARPGMPVTIEVPAQHCLVRTVARPAIGARDVRRMIAFEADALLPIPAGAALIAARIGRGADAAGRVTVDVAGLPIEGAHAILRAAAAAGVVPVAVVLAEDDATAPLDFAPALREAGLIETRRSATPWLWGLVALLTALNVVLWIGRDVARVEGFARTVAEQQPAVGIAQTIARRGEQDRRRIASTLALRRAHDPLGALAAVSRAVPPGVWLQRLRWDGASVRLVGYRPAEADVATALRRSGRFADVRTLGDATQATMPTGEPFDLSARVRNR